MGKDPKLANSYYRELLNKNISVTEFTDFSAVDRL